MKLGVLTNLYGALALDETLDKLKALGIESIEIGDGQTTSAILSVNGQATIYTKNVRG